MASSSSSDNDGTENTEHEEKTKRTKRARTSKRDVPEYKWTEDAVQLIADFVKENSALYDKTQKDYMNVATKGRMWANGGKLLDPPATGDQCKKLYENMRTRLGKILNKEKKSGSGQTNRTTRDDEIVNTWGFLKQHIVRGKTTASDTFDREGEVLEREDDEVSIMTVSEDMDNETLIPLKDRVPMSARSEASGTSGSRTPASRSSTVLQNNLDDALRQVLSRADNLGQTAALTGQKKIVHDFACLLEGHMQKIPEESWHSFQIECLQLVHNFKQPTRPTQPCQQQPSSWQSSQWPINSHWSSFNQWSPASPSFNNVGMPAAPSAVPVPIPTSSQQSTASTPPSRRSNEMVSSVLEELGEEE